MAWVRLAQSVSRPEMTHGSVSDGSLSQRLALLQRGTNPSQIETLQFTSRGLHHHPADTGAKVWRTFIFGSSNRKRERLRSFSKLSIFGPCINWWFNTVIQQLSEIRKSSLSHLPPLPLVSVRLHVFYLLPCDQLGMDNFLFLLSPVSGFPPPILHQQ